jgi:uncharacterized membrane protein
MTPTTVLAAHAAVTWFLTGVIWVVQVVHYPLFAYADRATYPAFAEAHGRLITVIVGPAMLAELVTGAWLVMARPDALPQRWAVAGLALVLVIWLSTAVLQVPLHGQLAQGYDARAHAWLVGSNWIRTVAWTARSVMLLVVLGRALRLDS